MGKKAHKNKPNQKAMERHSANSVLFVESGRKRKCNDVFATINDKSWQNEERKK